MFMEIKSYVVQVSFGTHNNDFVMTGYSANGNQGQKKGPFNPLNNLLHNSNAKNFVYNTCDNIFQIFNIKT